MTRRTRRVDGPLRANRIRRVRTIERVFTERARYATESSFRREGR